MIQDGKYSKVFFPSDNRNLTGEAKLARIFGSMALVITAEKGHETSVTNMLLGISVSDKFPHPPVYAAISQCVGAGICQIELSDADKLPEGYLVLISPSPQ